MRIFRLLCILGILVFAIMMLWQPMMVVDGVKPTAQRLSGITAGLSSAPQPSVPAHPAVDEVAQKPPVAGDLGLDAPALPPAIEVDSSQESEARGDAAGSDLAEGARDGDQPPSGAVPVIADDAGSAELRVPASLRAVGFQPAFATFPELEQFRDVTPAILASKFEQDTGISEGTALGLVGGVVDEIVNVPWMVGIRKRRQESDGAALATSICGGAVFARRWVITAAHCLDDDYNLLEIIAGASDLDSEDVIRRVSRRAFIHAGYDASSFLRDDVAVIALDQAMPPFIPDAPFPTAEQLDQIPSIARVIGRGFGVTENGFDRNFLKKVELEVLEEGTGYRVIRVADPEGDIEGLCEGDSGSPVEGIVEDGDNFIIGMVSFNEQNAANAPRCTTPSFPAGVVNLEGYMEDIRALVDMCAVSPETCFGE